MERADTVAVYGMGRIGSIISASLLRNGYTVIGVDVDPDRVEGLSHGEPTFPNEPNIDSVLNKAVNEKRFKTTIDGNSASKESKYKVVTVPVYLTHNEPSYKSLESAAQAIGGGLQKEDLVSIESSVPLGTTRNVIMPLLEAASGLKAEEDFWLSYSPERLFEGRGLQDLEENYPKVVSGVGPKSLVAAVKFYERIVNKGVLKLSSIETAEMEKLMEGVYRDVNIALANELALICEKAGIDFWEAMDTANSQPFSHLHRPGAGVGGNCIPVYPYFIVRAAKCHEQPSEIIEEARELNELMPRHVVNKLLMLFIKRRRNVKHITILGLAFRGDIDDDRASPTYSIVDRLEKLGISVRVHDPYVRKPTRPVNLISDLGESLKGADGIIIATDHSVYRDLTVAQILKLSGSDPLIFDARGVLLKEKGNPNLSILGIA